MIAEDIVNLGQDPFVEFPASNVTKFEDPAGQVPKLFSRFLGFFGPQGALPLNTTVDAYLWSNGRDPSFARFTDIFSNRFLQLFFRAWANAQPIAHHDRPDDDRFADYVGSFAGIGVASLKGRDSLDDIAKLPFAGLVNADVKSASRLRQLVRGIFHVDVDIEERVGSWLTFEPSDQAAARRRCRARPRHLSRRARLLDQRQDLHPDQGARPAPVPAVPADRRAVGPAHRPRLLLYWPSLRI